MLTLAFVASKHCGITGKSQSHPSKYACIIDKATPTPATRYLAGTK